MDGGVKGEGENKTEAKEKKLEAESHSEGSGKVTRKSLSLTLDSVRLKKSATSLPRKREEVRMIITISNSTSIPQSALPKCVCMHS